LCTAVRAQAASSLSPWLSIPVAGAPPMIGPPAVASKLGFSIPSAIRLMRAGLAGPVYTDGQREMVSRKLVDKLARRQPLTDLADLPAAFVLRVGPRQEDPSKEDDRPWYGWDEMDREGSVRFGISRKWPVRDAEKLRGRLLIVTVSGVVAHVARIVDVTPIGDEWGFELTDPRPDDTEAQAWQNVRVPTTGEGKTLRHGLD
jgi:hypothetical protein